MKVLSAIDYNQRLRVSIQSSGRLSITSETVRCLGLAEGSKILFGQDDNDPKLLYFIIPADNERIDAFEVKSSSGNYYIQTRAMFDALGISYNDQKNVKIFDLIRSEEVDAEAQGKAYLMKDREVAEDVEER